MIGESSRVGAEIRGKRESDPVPKIRHVVFLKNLMMKKR